MNNSTEWRLPNEDDLGQQVEFTIGQGNGWVAGELRGIVHWLNNDGQCETDFRVYRRGRMHETVFARIAICPLTEAPNLAEYAYEAFMLAKGDREGLPWSQLAPGVKHLWRMVVVAIYKVITRQPERFGLHKVRTKGAHPLSERELLK